MTPWYLIFIYFYFEKKTSTVQGKLGDREVFLKGNRDELFLRDFIADLLDVVPHFP